MHGGFGQLAVGDRLVSFGLGHLVRLLPVFMEWSPSRMIKKCTVLGISAKKFTPTHYKMLILLRTTR